MALLPKVGCHAHWGPLRVGLPRRPPRCHRAVRAWLFACLARWRGALGVMVTIVTRHPPAAIQATRPRLLGAAGQALASLRQCGQSIPAQIRWLPPKGTHSRPKPWFIGCSKGGRHRLTIESLRTKPLLTEHAHFLVPAPYNQPPPTQQAVLKEGVTAQVLAVKLTIEKPSKRNTLSRLPPITQSPPTQQAVVKEGVTGQVLAVKLTIEKPSKGSPDFARGMLGMATEADPVGSGRWQ